MLGGNVQKGVDGTQIHEEVWQKSEKIIKGSVINGIILMLVLSRREV